MAKSPDAFRTISEVADWLDTPAHVLRFWESKFSQIKPVKRAGGRRYYRPDDMALLGGIKQLLHEDGMTIKGVQKLLKERGVRHVAARGPAPGGIGEEAAADAAPSIRMPPDLQPPSRAAEAPFTDVPDRAEESAEIVAFPDRRDAQSQSPDDGDAAPHEVFASGDLSDLGLSEEDTDQDGDSGPESPGRSDDAGEKHVGRPGTAAGAEPLETAETPATPEPGDTAGQPPADPPLQAGSKADAPSAPLPGDLPDPPADQIEAPSDAGIDAPEEMPERPTEDAPEPPPDELPEPPADPSEATEDGTDTPEDVPEPPAEDAPAAPLESPQDPEPPDVPELVASTPDRPLLGPLLRARGPALRDRRGAVTPLLARLDALSAGGAETHRPDAGL